jgi:D-glycero-D-manno-heptose 1,7-bisphosphate phosphatase
MRPAIFLDKDGTLVVDVPYNVDPGLIELTPYARPACQALHAAGFALVVVTNQSGVARGLFEAAALEAVEARLLEMLGVSFAGFYHCPHAADAGCRCRKPADGMLRQAAAEHRLDLARSWMIGDILNDVEAGRRAGCRTILIDNGGETEWLEGPHRTPHFIVSDVGAAALTVLNSERKVA